MAQVGITPSPPPTSVPYGPTNEVRLTPQEQQAWQQYRGQILQQGAGPLVNSPQWQQTSARGQVNALTNVEANASDAADRMVLRDIVSGPGAGTSRMIATGRLAPIYGYAPAGQTYSASMLRNQAQHAALMQALLGGQTGSQGLQSAMQGLQAV
jgi:hypothetical protein